MGILMTNLEQAQQLLVQLRQRGIRLQAKGSRLHALGDATAMNTETADRIRLCKPALLELLGSKSGMQRAIQADPENRYQPFPLNENQQAYWLGRSAHLEGGNVAIHLYFEIDASGLDIDRLEQSWRQIVLRHEMLRAVVTPDGQQQIMRQVPDVSIGRIRTTEPHYEQTLLGVRERLSHQNFDLQQWPQFEFSCISGDDRQTLCLSIDCWAIDGWSYQILFVEWAQLYFSQQPLPEFGLSFRDYCLALARNRDSAASQTQRAWWQEHAATLPDAPALPRASGEEDSGRFERQFHWLEGDSIANLRNWCAEHGVSVAATLLTAYAAVLQRWSGSDSFTLNIPRFNRQSIHPDVNRIVGEFASFTLLALDWREPASFSQRVKAVQEDLLRAVSKDLVSGVQVLRMRNEVCGEISTMPYVFTNAPEQHDARGEKQSFIDALELFGPLQYAISQTPQVWIDCQYHESKRGLYLFWDVRQGIFPAGMTEQMFDSYIELLNAVTESRLDDEQPVSVPDVAPTPEPFQPSSLDIWERMEQRVISAAQEAALVTPQTTLSWRQLKQRSLALAASLLEEGIGISGRILLLAEKGEWQSIAVLAAVYRGLTVVPLDVATPRARLEFIASDTEATCVLYSPSQEVMAQSLGLPALPIAARASHEIPHRQPSPDVLITIYTSGSTGRPKGVNVRTKALLNAVDYTLARFDINDQDRLLALTQLHHDMAWFDLLAMLSCGARLIYPHSEHYRDSRQWAQLMRRHRVTVWNSVPQLMEMLLSQAAQNEPPLHDLRLAFLGGDWIGLSLPARLKHYAPHCQLVSVGGPTETTLWNIMYQVNEVSRKWRSIPYGYPIANNRYRILDAQGRDCPIGVTGELCCTGIGVSPGYLNRPELNAEKFRRDSGGQRMFLTGDLGRYRADGSIEFLGRRDSQMMLGGYRIEPHEVVKQLCTIKGIEAAELGILEGQLVAWLVAKSDTGLSSDSLADTLADWLPPQMIPARFYRVDELPLTNNGKVDRQRLESMLNDPLAEQRGGAQPLTTDHERQIAECWRAVLGDVPRWRDDDFFRCGGHSLAAVKLYGLLWPQGHDRYSVVTLFEHRTVAAQAALLADSNEKHAGPALRAQQLVVAPLTRAQRRIWFSEQLNTGLSVYNLPFRIRIDAEIDLQKAARALQQAFARHQLFSSVVTEDGRWRYQPEMVGNIEVIETGLTEDQTLERAWLQAGQCFDVSRGPLWCAVFVTRVEGYVELLLTIHHIVFDGWSLPLLLDDWQACYAGEALPAPALQYFDYAVHEQQQGDSETDLRFWQQQLESYQPLTLATDFDRPMRQSFKVETCVRQLGSEQVAALQRCASDEQTTLFVLLASAWQLLLSRYADQDDLVVGTHIAQRDRPDLQKLPGMLLNNLVLRAQLTPDMPFSALLEQQRDYCHNAFCHAALPFDSLVGVLGERRDASRHPLYQVSIVVDNSEIRNNRLGLSLEPACQQHGHMDLELNVQQLGDEMRASFVYATDLFRHETIEQLADQFIHLLQQVVATPEKPLSSFSFNTPDQQALLREAGSGSHDNWPQQGMAEIWDGTVRRQGAKTAIYEDTCQISFTALDQRARAIAHGLFAQGIEPGDTLAVHLPPGIDLVTALLALMQLGCCYLPLQPDLPAQRMERMLQVAGCKRVIGEALSFEGYQCLSLKNLEQTPASGDRGWQRPAPDKTNLYMMFTSGSTGEPKAITATEQATLNRFHWSWRQMPFEADECCALKTAPGFVDSIWETLGPLLLGCPLAVIGYLDQLEPARMLTQLSRRRVTRLLMVPSLMDSLLAWCEADSARTAQLSHLRWLSLSGETLTAQLVARLQAALPNTKIVNLYGSAEVGADVLALVLDDENSQQVPLGRPLSNTWVRLEDSWGCESPLGGRGEMVIGGAQVIDGYVNQSEHPQFAENQGRRCFRSRDLGRLGHQRQFYYLGRNDHTVKIRGQRLSLGDVNQALLACPGVSAAAAQPIDSQLLGAMLVLDGVSLSEAQLALRSRLPGWMVPGRWLPCEALPTLPNGKVDQLRVRSLLSAQPDQAVDNTDRRSQWSATERQLSQLWESLTEQLVQHREQSFFDAGGHSLLLTRLLNRINRQFGLSLDIASLYSTLELSRMAALIDALSGETLTRQTIEEEGVL